MTAAVALRAGDQVESIPESTCRGRITADPIQTGGRIITALLCECCGRRHPFERFLFADVDATKGPDHA